MAPAMRFVIAGTGNISRTYHTVISKLPGTEVVGFVSRRGNRPAYLPSDVAVETATELDDLTVDYEAVVLATPNGLHRDGAVAAARLGKHVLTEKPLEVSLERMDAMIGACRRADVRLGVAYQRRMSPDNRALKALLDDGRLGRLYAADLSVKFFRDQAYYDSAPYRGTWEIDGGGAFTQQASHNVDLYCWFFGMPERVVSMWGTLGHDVEVEDHGVALLRHADGMIGSIIASTVARPGFPARLEVHAERGSIVLENDVITTWEADGLENPSTPPSGVIHSGATVAVTDTAGHEAVVSDFVQAVRERRDPAIPGESARLATELILKIYGANVI
jgi:UDP-N-acetyl-2-amino-2-deoxyglucuronate dehydrogenase